MLPSGSSFFLLQAQLSHLLPNAIAQNPHRGEQGADWYLHYNVHRQRWRDQLAGLAPKAQEILWRSYDREKILALFDDYPFIERPPDKKVTRDLSHQLLRCLSAGYYLSEAE